MERRRKAVQRRRINARALAGMPCWPSATTTHAWLAAAGVVACQPGERSMPAPSRVANGDCHYFDRVRVQQPHTPH
jgi:hypothetical protein